MASDLRKVVTEDYKELTERELSLLRDGMNDQIERVRANIKKGQAIKAQGLLEADKQKEVLKIAISKISDARKRISDA